MIRSLILCLLLAPLTACYAAPVAKPRVAKAEKPAPAPAPEPAPTNTELADPFAESAVTEDLITEEIVPEDPSCPMAVTGTSVAFLETETGAALVFETGDIAEVRTRLDAIAMDHNEANPSADATTVHASGGATYPKSTRVPRVTTPSQATVEITATGVRIFYTAEPQFIESLREELREQAITMAGGRCEASP
jgi:hypothetical protein